MQYGGDKMGHDDKFVSQIVGDTLITHNLSEEERQEAKRLATYRAKIKAKKQEKRENREKNRIERAKRKKKNKRRIKTDRVNSN